MSPFSIATEKLEIYSGIGDSRKLAGRPICSIAIQTR
jgi:hypothetical protein